ncbi:plastid movement impaired protein [Gossypium australe]|uniref:Plastid movement impaired protein n=1 Tax=Gossypium australe TaxID=47621 RepID=A0A5B6V9P2_9ROSI|nr:plastid movement impaired protein [Gossypium australe]
MGNSLAGKKTTKVMKINGETLKLKTPVRAEDVVLESEAVKHFGVRAKPLEAHHKLEPKRLYFLVVLPEGPKERVPRRVRSGVNMSAKDRLESLMLSRRSVSDLTLMKGESTGAEKGESGAMRVRLRVPKAEVERLMKESENEGEVAEKIMQLCTANGGNSPRVGAVKGKQQVRWEGSHGSTGEGFKAREKRVSFVAVKEGGGSQIEVGSGAERNQIN